MKKIPEFAIFQNDRTKVTGLWIKNRGEWIEADKEEYEILALLAQLIRTTPNPSEVIAMFEK